MQNFEVIFNLLDCNYLVILGIAVWNMQFDIVVVVELVDLTLMMVTLVCLLFRLQVNFIFRLFLLNAVNLYGFEKLRLKIKMIK